MQNPSSSTIRFESTTTIDRPIGDVFARLTDLSGYSVWMPRTGLFGKCRQTSESPVGNGTEYVDVSRMGQFQGVVTEFEGPSRVAFSETMRMFGRDLMQARPAYSLEANGMSTVVHHVAESELFGVMRMMKPVAVWMANGERNRVLKSLKRSLETGRDRRGPASAGPTRKVNRTEAP